MTLDLCDVMAKQWSSFLPGLQLSNCWVRQHDQPSSQGFAAVLGMSFKSSCSLAGRWTGKRAGVECARSKQRGFRRIPFVDPAASSFAALKHDPTGLIGAPPFRREHVAARSRQTIYCLTMVLDMAAQMR